VCHKRGEFDLIYLVAYRETTIVLSFMYYMYVEILDDILDSVFFLRIHMYTCPNKFT